MLRSRAFTLVELLVVIAIIGVLVGLMLPALQNMRELARRNSCQHNLMQVSLAVSAYSVRFGHYPIGTVNDSGPIKSEPKGFHHNWISGLLPMLDAENVYQAVNRNASVYDPSNDPVRSLRIPVLVCPSASQVRENTTCYSGIHASRETPIAENGDGVFVLNQLIGDNDISDGLGYTVFVGEKLSAFEEDLGWISGTRSSLRNAGHAINAERTRIRVGRDPTKPVDPLYVGGLASDHAGGVQILLGSGECQFVSASMDRRTLRQMSSRADGGIPQAWKSSQGLGPAGKPPQQPGPGAEPPKPIPDNKASGAGENAGTSEEGEDAGTSKEGEDAGTSKEGEDAGTSKEGEDAGTSKEGEDAGVREPTSESEAEESGATAEQAGETSPTETEPATTNASGEDDRAEPAAESDNSATDEP